jgi:uncharacterized membrane-anchored protein
VATGRSGRGGPGVRTLRPLSKVPQITVFFWITKVLTTGMGEATSDYLAHRFGPVIAGLLGLTALVAALVVQFRVRRYLAWVYWTAVAMVAVFGTMAADGLHVELGVPYLVSTPFFAIALAVIFIVWYRTEETLSIHSIYTPRREVFYWATVLATFALGTAAGDLTATTMHLGFLASGILFTVVIAIPAIGYWRFNLNPIVAFWFAYIVTRPLGASYADWMGVPRSLSGLNIGRGPVALGLTIVIAGFVAYLAISRTDVEETISSPDTPERARHRRQARQPDRLRGVTPVRVPAERPTWPD